jgi:enoyl-CoA hydratase/carnithine racemase
MSYVVYEKKDHIAYITLNRPDRLNALGTELVQQWGEAESSFAEDDDAWVAIYTGAGDRAFCAGLDLKEAAERGSQGAKRGSQGAMPLPSKFKPLLEQSKPTIAAINGIAYGGGFEIALRCDIRICSENARFALAEVKRGLCPPIGSFYLPRLIGMSNAMWWLLSGEPVDAQEAYRIGLVTRVVPFAELLPTATKMAEVLCENGPLAVQATKKLVRLGLEVPADYGYRLGLGLMDSVWGSEDAMEGARAFAEKRKPIWKMR